MTSVGSPSRRAGCFRFVTFHGTAGVAIGALGLLLLSTCRAEEPDRLPATNPFPWGEVPPSAARDFIEAYRDHRVSQWVRRIYREHRKPPPG